MNDAHLHLAVNHFPVIGLVIGFLVLLFGLLFNDRKVRMTALGILIFSSLTAFAANLTGELAEDVVEKLPGISEAYIETHEDVAELFLWSMIVTGALALILLILEIIQNKKRMLGYIPLIVSIAVSGYFAKITGTTGGEIRHPEIRQENIIIKPNSELKKIDKKIIKRDDN
jgi:FtsH-binding integral membrane protein